MSNSEARRHVLGPKVQSLEQALNQNGLKCFDMFCTCPWNDCLVVRCYPRKVMIGTSAEVGSQ